MEIEKYELFISMLKLKQAIEDVEKIFREEELKRLESLSNN